VEYEIPSYVGQEIRGYFAVDPTSGVLYLKKSLLTKRNKQYGVSSIHVYTRWIGFIYRVNWLSGQL